MTAGAQQALRRTMELFSATTRFALSCNNSAKVIEPIQSRCAILRYTRLSDSQVVARLQHVIQEEKIVEWNKEGLEALVFTAEGDMRQALNNTQSTYAGFQRISPDAVFKVRPTAVSVAMLMGFPVSLPHPLHLSEARCAINRTRC